MEQPDNCDIFTVPKTNANVWKDMKDHTKGNDINLQRITVMINKSVAALLPLMDLLKQRKDLTALNMCMGAFRMMGMTSIHISQKRRDLAARDLSPIYRPLAISTHPINGMLFGEEAAKELKELKESRSMTLRHNPSYSRDHKQVSGYGGYSSKSRKSGKRQLQHQGLLHTWPGGICGPLQEFQVWRQFPAQAESAE